MWSQIHRWKGDEEGEHNNSGVEKTPAPAILLMLACTVLDDTGSAESAGPVNSPGKTVVRFARDLFSQADQVCASLAIT